jgi:hypothetical protein
MSQTPSQSNVTFNRRMAFQDIRSLFAENITLNSITVDPLNTPTTQLRAGLVVGQRADGTYVDAADATVVAHTSSAITSLVAPVAGWQGETLTATVPGLGTITHTFAASVTNIATAIADVTANPVGGLVSPANSAGNLQLTANKPGVLLSITCSLAGAFEAVGGVEITNNTGALTIYGILRDGIPSMIGIADVVEDKNAHIATKRFVAISSAIDNLTTAARQYFDANGVTFI